MFKPKYFDLKALQDKVDWPDLPAGWTYYSFGGMRGEHFYQQHYTSALKAKHATPGPCIGETEFEQHVLLSVLDYINRRDMVFVELGAGWGIQTLFVATAIREQVIPMVPKDLWTLAVEAEPGHYRFLCETFHANRLEGLPIYGAISDTERWGKFWAFNPSPAHYGQALHEKGNLDVPVFRLDYLMDMFKVDRVDLVHIDLQRQEPQAIRGTLGHISDIDYLLICPHEDYHMVEIEQMLDPTHDLCISIGPRSGSCQVDGFPLPVHHPVDGIMLFERRGP